MRARPTLMLATIFVLALSMYPARAAEHTCQAGPSSATNVTVGDLFSHGDAPGCTMSFPCDNIVRRACTVSVVGSVSGQGLVGVVALIDGSALAECWGGLGACVTSRVEREIPYGSTVPVGCAFRNGMSSDAVVTCRAEFS